MFMTFHLLRVPKPDSLEDQLTRVKGATSLSPMGRVALADIARAFVNAGDLNYEEMLAHAEGFVLNLEGDPNYNPENEACLSALQTVELMRRVISHRSGKES